MVGRFVDDSCEQDGQLQRRMTVEADLVAASLRWAIARPFSDQRRSAAMAAAGLLASGCSPVIRSA